MVGCKSCVFSRLRSEVIARNPQWPESWPKYECRRRAPVVAVDGNGDEVNPWPLVHEDDRCGDGMLPGQQTALEKHAQALAVVVQVWANVHRTMSPDSTDRQIQAYCDDLRNIIEEGRA